MRKKGRVHGIRASNHHALGRTEFLPSDKKIFAASTEMGGPFIFLGNRREKVRIGVLWLSLWWGGGAGVNDGHGQGGYKCRTAVV